MKWLWFTSGLVVLALTGVVLAGCGKKPEQPAAQSPQQTTAQPAPATAAPAQEATVEDKAAVAEARKLGTPTTNPVQKTASGLQYIDVKEGKGDPAKAGDTVQVHYTGWLVDGKKFDSSVDRGQPFSFSLGGGQVIKGWDEGVAGMKPGGVRKLIIPPQLGYGPSGTPGGPIPPNATLIFEVQYLGKQ